MSALSQKRTRWSQVAPPPDKRTTRASSLIAGPSLARLMRVRRGTTLAPEEIAAQLGTVAGHASQSMKPGWDGEPTELDLRLDITRVERARRRVQPPVAPSTAPEDEDLPLLAGPQDEDLPLLDDSETGALNLADRGTLGDRGARPPERSASSSVDRSAWIAAFALGSALLLAVWMVRLELVRFLGLI